jgi:hypothetical protein
VLRTKRLEPVKGVRLTGIASAFPGLDKSEELRAAGRYPLNFSVGVDVDVTVSEPSLGSLGFGGPVVSVDNPTKIETTPWEGDARVYSDATLRRFIQVEATVALEGAGEQEYRDLKIIKAHRTF